MFARPKSPDSRSVHMCQLYEQKCDHSFQLPVQIFTSVSLLRGAVGRTFTENVVRITVLVDVCQLVGALSPVCSFVSLNTYCYRPPAFNRTMTHTKKKIILQYLLIQLCLLKNLAHRYLSDFLLFHMHSLASTDKLSQGGLLRTSK